MFLDLRKANSSHPAVLVLGGSVLGEGLDAIISDECVEFVDADVSWGPRTKIICEGHALPFANQSFDGVIVQAVLEHVVDPYVCVGEIHRVLRSSGVVYAETPSIQQVHGGPYDLTRSLTVATVGSSECSNVWLVAPAVVLAWPSVEPAALCVGFFASRLARTAVRGTTRLLFFWLKYFNHYLTKQPQALDAASAFYFLG